MFTPYTNSGCWDSNCVSCKVRPPFWPIKSFYQQLQSHPLWALSKFDKSHDLGHYVPSTVGQPKCQHRAPFIHCAGLKLWPRPLSQFADPFISPRRSRDEEKLPFPGKIKKKNYLNPIETTVIQPEWKIWRLLDIMGASKHTVSR